MKSLLNISWEEQTYNYFSKNKNYILLFFGLFAINILIYGQRLFGEMYAAEDYTRLLHGSGTQLSVGRWFNGVIGTYLLTKELHILPYFNSLIGIFSFTLAGFSTALLFNQKKYTPIAIITLLCSATPFVAHNLFFSTNFTAWLTVSWGVIGLYFAYNSQQISKKIIGLILLACAIGSYQTIIQVCLTIIVIKTIQEIALAQNTKKIKQTILTMLYGIAFVLIAFFISDGINTLLIKIDNPLLLQNTSNGYSNTAIWLSIQEYFTKIIQILLDFQSIGNIFWYNSLYVILLDIMFLLALSILTIYSIKMKKIITAKLIIIFLLMFSFIFIKELPELIVKNLINGIPPRSQYTIGWMIAGFFTIAYTITNKKYNVSVLYKNIILLVPIGIITISILYNNVFFFTMHRQTQADIIRANQMVTQIRVHPNYTNEKKPLQLKIVGTKYFSVPGNNWIQQAFALWSKYKIIEKFTDFNFVNMPPETYKNISLQMTASNKKIEGYPSNNSIYVKNNNVIIFLNPTEINEKIFKNNLSNYTPIKSNSGFSLYKIQDYFCISKNNISPQESSSLIFLHVIPTNKENLRDKKYSYNSFGSFIPRKDKNNAFFNCIELPLYQIKQMNVGQYTLLSKKEKLIFILEEIKRRKETNQNFISFIKSVFTIIPDIRTNKIQFPGRLWETSINMLN